ncbi:5456_t:CDS:2, partial [Dentiscutata heterogama]
MPNEVFGSLYFLPDPVLSVNNSNYYSSFNSMYESETNNNYCPSLLQNQEKQECRSNNLYTYKNINGW